MVQAIALVVVGAIEHSLQAIANHDEGRPEIGMGIPSGRARSRLGLGGDSGRFIGSSGVGRIRNSSGGRIPRIAEQVELGFLQRLSDRNRVLGGAAGEVPVEGLHQFAGGGGVDQPEGSDHGIGSRLDKALGDARNFAPIGSQSAVAGYQLISV